jgi:hypothetical protein
MAEEKKPSIFRKMAEVGSAVLDAQLAKAMNQIADANKKSKEYNEADFEWGKAVTRDRGFYMGSQGFQEKAGILSFDYQKQMAAKSSIIAAIIKTYQNRVAAHSEYVPQGTKTGFRIVLKHEQDQIDQIKEELFGTGEIPLNKKTRSRVQKSEQPSEESVDLTGADPVDSAALTALAGTNPLEIQEEPLTEADMDREARKELDKRTRKRKNEIADFIVNCGDVENRPFESRRWSFNAFLRAITGDSLIFDQISVELVPKEAEILDGRLNIHHFQPVDGSTIRYASQELSNYKNIDMKLAQDILYPEEELKALEDRDALELNQDRLDRNEYKYVQVIRGRIQRAFTDDELKIGMRNPTTDIYANGYSVSELELLVALVTSHLQTEFYNRSYFQQGFSAKGILHIKANLNRGKLEELRRHWNHMVKGNRNSFQTPIMAGMDEVQWIPLTQSHSEMEFSMWLNYLVRMICAIYQIDPSEIGYGIKDEGRGGGLSGDNTKEKLANSRDKGFIPLMKFLQDFINKNIISNLDPEYKLEWVGLEDESDMARIARQKEEVQWKKSLNEIRAEDGLPPFKGCDQLLLNPIYFNWFSSMSEEGQRFTQQQQQQAMGMGPGMGGPEQMEAGGENLEGDQKNWEAEEASKENDHMRNMESKLADQQHEKAMSKSRTLKKSQRKPLKVEYYRLGE